MKTFTLLITILFATTTIYMAAQSNKQYIDYEPLNLYIKPIDFFSFRKYKYIIPYSKNNNETESEFQIRIAEYKIKNDSIDKINQAYHEKYIADSIKYEQYIAEWQIAVLAWRKRNPNWRNTASYKGEINVNRQGSVQSAQSVIGEKYKVNTQTLNLRTGPGKNYSAIQTLKLDDEVILINNKNVDWWYVDYNGIKGYVFSQFLKEDPYRGWEKKNYQTGVTPECENVSPKYDYDLENYLKITVGSNTEVVVKLMQIGYNNDECIRIVYVRSGDTYEIKNIPEGRYYLKIAYGEDYRQKIVDNQCYVKFMKDAQYEKGIEILDFYKIKEPNQRVGNDIYESWSVPSFEIWLDVIVSKTTKETFKSSDISEAEFNK